MFMHTISLGNNMYIVIFCSISNKAQIYITYETFLTFFIHVYLFKNQFIIYGSDSFFCF